MLYAKSRGIGQGKGFLNRKNLLSMTKVICGQSVNTKNQVINKSKAVYSNDQINTNHRQFSLTETDHSNCKLFNLRKKQLLSFLIFQKIYRWNTKKYIYFWYIHFDPHYTRACIEFLISIEQHIFLWIRTLYGFFNIWSMKKVVFFISEGFYSLLVNKECFKRICT